MLLSIIIVSFNTEQLTKQAIESAIADIQQSKLLKRQAEIIVIDNHSDDGSLKMLRTLCKESRVSLIVNRENKGYAAANNQGITRARGEYLLLLNSDAVIQPGTLDIMVNTFQEAQPDDSTAVLASDRGRMDRLGILAASLLNPDGTEQPQGGSFPTLLSLASHMLMLDDLPVVGRWLPSTQHTGRRTQPLAQSQAQLDSLVAKDWVGGTALMFRQAVVQEIGLLDENIFMYGEDIEFCLRAKHHHWDVAIQPQATVIHHGSASSSSANAIIGEAKGYLYIWSKHKPLWQVPLVRVLLKIGARLRLMVFGTIKPDAKKQAAYRRLLQTI